MKLELWYEAKPFSLNQDWGVLHLNSKGENIYEQFGFKFHNGIDIAPGINKRIRAPFPFRVYRTLNQPNGGGITLSIMSTNEYEFEDGKKAHVLVDYLHLDHYIVSNGSGDTGTLLAIADNTGFSTGIHTHAQYRRVKLHKTKGFVEIDKNDANNSFDPMPYYNGKHAVDFKVSPEIVYAHLAVEQHEKAVAGIRHVPAAKRAYFLSFWEKSIKPFKDLLK